MDRFGQDGVLRTEGNDSASHKAIELEPAWGLRRNGGAAEEHGALLPNGNFTAVL